MKLIEDDGTVIEEMPNDAAVFYIDGERRMRTVNTKQHKDESQLPFNARVVRGLLPFLGYESNVKLVLRHAPTQRNPKHRHH